MHGGGYCHMSAHEKAPTSQIPRRLIKVSCTSVAADDERTRVDCRCLGQGVREDLCSGVPLTSACSVSCASTGRCSCILSYHPAAPACCGRHWAPFRGFVGNEDCIRQARGRRAQAGLSDSRPCPTRVQEPTSERASEEPCRRSGAESEVQDCAHWGQCGRQPRSGPCTMDPRRSPVTPAGRPSLTVSFMRSM